MTSWTKIYSDDCTPPADRSLDELTTELAACLKDPDPRIRDGHP
ncbi:hypothetical protein ACFVXE_31335 [Streptomyces sp. NPDC058231]